MAPKLPPPANTKAVFAAPARLVTDKASVDPAFNALARSRATFGGVYSSGRARRATDKSLTDRGDGSYLRSGQDDDRCPNDQRPQPETDGDCANPGQRGRIPDEPCCWGYGVPLRFRCGRHNTLCHHINPPSGIVMASNQPDYVGVVCSIACTSPERGNSDSRHPQVINRFGALSRPRDGRCYASPRADDAPHRRERTMLRIAGRALRPGIRGSALDERLFNDEMAGLAMAALEKTARFKHLAQLFEHARTTAHHDAVVTDIQRRQADIVEQLLRGDQVGDTPAIAKRLAGDGRIIQQLFFQQRS